MKNTVRLVVGGLLIAITVAAWAPAESTQAYRLQAVDVISDATTEISWYADWLNHTHRCDWPEYRDWRRLTEHVPSAVPAYNN